MKKSFPAFFILLFFLAVIYLSPKVIQADSMQDVLGDSTQTSAQIPPTTEGPGLLLPDSPLFFLDLMKQQVRLFLAFTPEAKAKVYESVAGERFAELRYMLDRQNKAGIYTDLRGVSDNFRGASDQLDSARLSGRDVSALAREINADIKNKQDSLDGLEKEETGSLKIEVEATQKSLMESKVKVENSLPAQDLAGEVRADIKRELSENLNQAAVSVSEMQRELTVLSKYSAASGSAAVLGLQQKTVSDTEDALKKAKLDVGNINNLLSVMGNESAMAGESASPK